MAKPTGVLGGTFDPVHFGHLGLATQVYRLCDLAELRLIPLHSPSHRQAPIASPQQRLQMLRLATQAEKGLVVDDRELQRGGVSYSIDTLKSLRQEAGQQGLCLVMGIDSFRTLDSWRQWKSLIEFAHIVVAGRPGIDRQIEQKELLAFFEAHRTMLVSDLHTYAAGKILEVDITEIDISSTLVRESINNKLDLQALLPESVITYIKKEGLYHRH